MTRDYYSPYFYSNKYGKAHLLELKDDNFTGKTLCGIDDSNMVEGRFPEMEVCKRCWHISKNIIDDGDLQ